ncbi:PREDICTED: WD repeat-containing protein 6 [Sturnus vulgaris]|uniref:WD repeat-containing protein 6 n=1 Tax=Sturnus vulgaris TaxID=9172 RepID=UPI00071A4FB0|nr:PREDICTED: WD repeat-containing protein 6 [Sturnus vulgaris]
MESVTLVAPVTALEFAGDVLLAGPEVVAFRLSGSGPAAAAGRRRVLREASVQGLRAEPGPGPATRVAVFGGRWLAVLAVRRSGAGGGSRLAVCGGGAARQLGARVWEVRWAAGSRLALALGGGTMALYEWRGGGRWLQQASCGGAGALRCAVLAGVSWARLALAAGTAMGAVVVWRAAAAKAPQRQLRGHRGAVLALCYAASRGLLASASEDRSVRLWAVGELGIGDGPGVCLLVCYGHGSRVAAVVLRGPLPVSAGEDGACLEWGGGGGVRRARRGHRGALRALALRPAGGRLATGGDDGGVRLWQPWRAAAEAVPAVAALGAPERPRAVLLVGPRRVLALGEAGGLAIFEVAQGRWTPVLHPTASGPRSVLAAAPLHERDETLCAVAGGDGRLLLFALSRPAAASKLRLFEGAVHGLSWAPRHGLPPDTTAALLASGHDGEMLWLDVTHRPGQAPWVRLMGRYLLPPCKQRWHTCAAFLPQEELLVCGDRRGSLLLFPCSSSSGRAAESTSIVIGGTDPVVEDSSNELEPSCLLHKGTLPLEPPLSVLYGLHGKTGVTSVTIHRGYIYSTGRDGVYRQLRLRDQQLEVLQKHRPSKGLQWIEELHFTSDGDLLVLGFHADNFVVWSSRTGENVYCIPCGGGHRSWSYCSSPLAKVFAFIKSGDVMLYHCEAEPCKQQVLLPSLHGREITCVRRLGAVEVPGHATVNVFVTGSEDTTACVLVLNENSRAAVPLARLSDHISSVRTLAFAMGPGDKSFGDEGLSALLFSAGGRAQIECYRLLCAGDTESECAVACQVIHVASHRLDKHWEKKKNRHKLVKMDPETRYMSLSVVPGTSTKQLPTPWKFLAAACSDGSVRIFGLLEAAQKLVLVAESFHHQRCVLKVEAFLHTWAGGERRHLLCSAATDGSIAFWDITGPIVDAADALHQEEGEMQPLALGAPLVTIMAHSCGVNSLHICETPKGQYLVASGSDDGSIHVCLLDVALGRGEATARTCLQVLERVSRPCAHAAHVTGIRLLRPDLLLSASVDQRLTLWKHCSGELVPLSTTFFHVPDLAELDCWEVVEAGGELRYYCVLCGQGLEMLCGTASSKPLQEAPQ